MMPMLWVDLFEGRSIQKSLLLSWGVGAGVEGAGEVGVVAVATNDVGVEGDECVGSDDVVAGFTEPGVGCVGPS